MSAIGEKTTRVKDDGSTEEVFTVEFTNGGIKQLEELKEFFKVPDLALVIQLGIAYLQRLKELKETQQKEGQS